MAIVIYDNLTGEARRVIQNSIGESQTNEHLVRVHHTQKGESVVFALDRMPQDYYISVAKEDFIK